MPFATVALLNAQDSVTTALRPIKGTAGDQQEHCTFENIRTGAVHDAS